MAEGVSQGVERVEVKRLDRASIYTPQTVA